MMDALIPVMRVVNPVPPYPEPWASLSDPDDIPVWAAAVAAGAKYVVSENGSDFPPPDEAGRHRHAGIAYVTIDEFFALLRLPAAT